MRDGSVLDGGQDVELPSELLLGSSLRLGAELVQLLLPLIRHLRPLLPLLLQLLEANRAVARSSAEGSDK